MSYVSVLPCLSYPCTCVLDIMQVGQWLADGYYAVVWGLLGDHDYKRDCLGLPNVLGNILVALVALLIQRSSPGLTFD